jgi:photosystem II stability/assembly factor-like uncharacterized protein
MCKIFLTTIIFITLSNVAFAQKYKQMMEDNRVNFYDVVKEAEIYFSNQINREMERRFESGMASEDDEEFEKFARWKYENECKYYPSGNRLLSDPLIAGKALQAYLLKNPIKNTRNLNTDWRNLGPNRVDSITKHQAAGIARYEDVWVSKTDANKIYLVSRSGGFWKTLDGGTTWIGGVSDTMISAGVMTLDVNPNNENEILINVNNGENGNSYGVYKSINGGASFSPTPFNYTNSVINAGITSGFKINRIKYHPLLPNIVFVGGGWDLWRSKDSLATFSKVITAGTSDIAFHPTNAAIIYAYCPTSNNNRVMRSIDTGKTWIAGPLLPTNGNNKLLLSTSPNCPTCIFALGKGGFYKSTDEGITFTEVGVKNIDNDLAFAVSDLDTSVMVGGYTVAFRSLNGGQTFIKSSWYSLRDSANGGGGDSKFQSNFKTAKYYVHPDLDRAICVNGIFYIVTDGFLCKSTDSAKTWVKLSQGVGTRENYGVGTSQSNHYMSYCGSQDNGSSLLLKNGWVETWGADGFRHIITPLNDRISANSTQRGDRNVSFNQGLNISPKNTGQSSGEWNSPFLLDPNNQMTLYDFKDSIFKTTDWGNTWAYVGKPNSFTANISTAAIAYNNSKIILISSGSTIEKSVNGGATFSPITNNLPNLAIKYIAIDPSNDSNYVVVYGTYKNDSAKVFISKNAGSSWTNISKNLTSMPIHSVIFDHTPAHNIYLGTELSVFTMPINGTSWVRLGNNLPNVPVREMDINFGSNTLKAATWGRGLWEHTLVGRDNYPAIVLTNITDAPTFDEPRETVNQYVTSSIHYAASLSNVYTMWSFDSMSFANILPMTNISDSTYKTNAPLPNAPVGSKVFFKVVAVGSAGDTSITYKFQYTIREYKHCLNTTNQGFAHYIKKVTLANINNNTNAWNPGTASSVGGFAPVYFNTPIGQLYADSTYTISVTPLNNYSQNDMGVWIDFNHDAFFNTKEEQVMFKINSSGSVMTATFKVPTNAYPADSIKMRVTHGYNTDSSNFGPCVINILGETEDYALRITSLATPLAIQDIDLNAKILNRNDIQLQWECLDEKDIISFDVQTSIDANHWDNIGIVNRTTAKKYVFSNTNVIAGIHYYRIAGLAKNNEYKYSNVKKINILPASNALSVMPNPTTNQLKLESANSITQPISIFDILGKEVMHIKPNYTNAMILDVSKLSAGVYEIKLGNEQVTFTKQ